MAVLLTRWKKELFPTALCMSVSKTTLPFALAGSIRDDGPLPDTQMDLIKAQEEYAQLLEGTDMIPDAVYYAALNRCG